MDSATPIIPSPSTGWGRLAATHGEPTAIVGPQGERQAATPRRRRGAVEGSPAAIDRRQ